MTDRPRDGDVIAKLAEHPGETLAPESFEAIQTAMHENLGRFIGARSYFVLGSYGADERPRLEAARDALDSEGYEAFLMDEIQDVTEFFTTKFKLLVSYADHVVGVYEHSRGGHAWEAGYLDQPDHRSRTQVFYRTYETESEQFGAYDGMFAHYLLAMERVGQAGSWRTTDDLLAAIDDTYGE